MTTPDTLELPEDAAARLRELIRAAHDHGMPNALMPVRVAQALLGRLDALEGGLKPFAEAADFWSPIYDDSEVMKMPAQFVDLWRAKHGKRKPIPQFVNGDLRRAAQLLSTTLADEGRDAG